MCLAKSLFIFDFEQFMKAEHHGAGKVSARRCSWCCDSQIYLKCQIIRYHCDHKLSVQYDLLIALGTFGQT